MLEIEEISNREIKVILAKVGYGHLACSRDNIPYVVPIHYAYDEPDIYVYTTEGLKSEIIDENPNVCLQVEEVVDNQHWKSVVVNGTANRLKDEPDREKAIQAIVRVNPTLTPAVSIRWMDNWVRENIEVILVIHPGVMTGRASIHRGREAAPLASKQGGAPPIAN